MLTTYIVLSALLSIVSVVLFLVALNDWSDSKGPYAIPHEQKEHARTALVFLAGVLLAWAWPIIVPLMFAYLAYRLIQDATAPDNN